MGVLIQVTLELSRNARGDERSSWMESVNTPIRRTCIRVMEMHAAGRELVDIRRANFFVSVAAEHPGAQILGDDQENIGSGARRLFLRGKG